MSVINVVGRQQLTTIPRRRTSFCLYPIPISTCLPQYLPCPPASTSPRPLTMHYLPPTQRSRYRQPSTARPPRGHIFDIPPTQALCVGDYSLCELRGREDDRLSSSTQNTGNGYDEGGWRGSVASELPPWNNVSCSWDRRRERCVLRFGRLDLGPGWHLSPGKSALVLATWYKSRK